MSRPPSVKGSKRFRECHTCGAPIYWVQWGDMIHQSWPFNVIMRLDFELGEGYFEPSTRHKHNRKGEGNHESGSRGPGRPKKFLQYRAPYDKFTDEQPDDD